MDQTNYWIKKKQQQKKQKEMDTFVSNIQTHTHTEGETLV